CTRRRIRPCRTARWRWTRPFSVQTVGLWRPTTSGKCSFWTPGPEGSSAGLTPEGTCRGWSTPPGAISWEPTRRRPSWCGTREPSGRRLVILWNNGQGDAWDMSPRDWERRACQTAGRILTRDEWRQFLPDRPYEPAC